MIKPIGYYPINKTYNKSNEVNNNKNFASNPIQNSIFSTISFRGKNVNPKQVAFVSFETVPINKTGGMADVVGELAPELRKKGFDVRVVIPLLNAKDGVQKNAEGKTVYRTHKGKEFVIEKLENSDYDYTYGTQKGHAEIYKVNDPKVDFPVYVIHNPDDVSKNKTEYQGWIMDQVKNQEAFCKSSLESLKKLENLENFKPKYVMSYEWTTAPIIEAMSKDPYFSDTKKIENINNFGSVYQGRVGAPVVAPYILSEKELTSHTEEPRTRALLNEINNSVNARMGHSSNLSLNKQINENDYNSAYIKVAQNYEKYIPYTTNHLGFLDKHLMESYPDKGWFKGYYNFFVPAVRHADYITSCSDTYMKEMQQEDRYSDGVQNLMNMMKFKTHGITIGLDYKLYNPAASPEETSKPIKYPFSVNEDELKTKPHLLNYKEGKQKNKEYLQEVLGKNPQEYNSVIGAKQYGYLDKNPNALLSSFITRFDPDQKGIDIAIRASKRLLEQEKNAQVVLAGPDFNKDNVLIKEYLNDVVKKYPGRAVLFDGFINNISQVYAGSDAVLIPSRFAPFELVQLQAMAMGAVPIVANAGGLSEIVVDENSNQDDKMLGFKTKESLLLSKNPDEDYSDTIRRAVNIKKNNPERWDKIMQNCLRYKRTWDKPAQAYIDTVFNPDSYSNIKDLCSIDDNLAFGSITPDDDDKITEDVKFLKNKGVKTILELGKVNKNIRKTAEEYGIKYANINMDKKLDEEIIYDALFEIQNNKGLLFLNENRESDNKSAIAAMHIASTTQLNSDQIISNVWSDRGINFNKLAKEDGENIKGLITKTSNFAKKYSFKNREAIIEAFKNTSSEPIEEKKDEKEELKSKFENLQYSKNLVYAGRYYLK